VLKAQAADGTIRPIVSTHDFEGFAVSHDGKLIAVATEPGHSKPNELHLMTSAGAEVKFLVGTGAKDDSYYLYPWAWSPNDKFLLYELEAEVSSLNVLDIATGAHWPLVDPDGPEGKMDLTGADWSPDGSFVVAGHYEQRHVWHVFDGVTYETVKRLTTVRK
jgi:WD40 repeat protein